MLDCQTMLKMPAATWEQGLYLFCHVFMQLRQRSPDALCILTRGNFQQPEREQTDPTCLTPLLCPPSCSITVAQCLISEHLAIPQWIIFLIRIFINQLLIGKLLSPLFFCWDKSFAYASISVKFANSILLSHFLSISFLFDYFLH